MTRRFRTARLLALPRRAAAARTSRSPAANPRRPLAGVRVLDLTRVIAGPVSTRLMAALGADVLRIDPPVLPELSDQFVDTAFGKRSAVADLGLPETRAALERLVAGADVVITGYRSGSLDRFGLDAASLLSTRPDLVVVTLNSWGTDGPWSRLRGFDSIVQAASGIAHLYGMTDDAGWRPGALPVQALDHATGYGAAAAAVTLLTRRRESGAGGSARLSLARTAEELFGLPPNPRRLQALPAPGYRTWPAPTASCGTSGLRCWWRGSRWTTPARHRPTAAPPWNGCRAGTEHTRAAATR